MRERAKQTDRWGKRQRERETESKSLRGAEREREAESQTRGREKERERGRERGYLDRKLGLPTRVLTLNQSMKSTERVDTDFYSGVFVGIKVWDRESHQLNH